MKRWGLALLVLLLVACEKTAEPAGKGTSVNEGAGTNVGPTDHPPLEIEKTPRQARRLSIAMLRGTFPVIFGNDANGQPITWRVGSRSGFDQYASTLGEPDFINTTEENAEPSPLYAKFMDDAARDACIRALDADATRTDKAARALLRKIDLGDATVTNLQANLRYLKRRILGVNVVPDQNAEIEDYQALFLKIAGAKPSTTTTRDAWRAVCVAMVTSPEFHVY